MIRNVCFRESITFFAPIFYFWIFSRDLLDISPTLTEAAGAIVDVSCLSRI